MLQQVFQNITQRINQISDSFFLFLLQRSAQSSLRGLEKDTANAGVVQQKVLKEILQLQKSTEYGKKYNFAAIQLVSDFRKAHPLTTYDDYQSTINDIAEGAKFTQLVSEPIILFQETSGTTGRVKLIPRTKRLFSSIQAAFQTVGAITESYFSQQQNGKTRSRGLALANTQPLDFTPSGIARGSGTSGGLRQSKFIQKIIRLRYTSPPEIFLVSDYSSAYYCHLLFGLLDPDLEYITANFASSILEVVQTLERKWQQLVNDIESGCINASIKLEASTRDDLQRLLQSNPVRAAALRTEFEQGFHNILPRIWSRLQYIQCITTGPMQLYQERLKFYTDGIPFYSPGYGASEAWIGVNLEPSREPPAYLLTPRTAFFEFIPIGEVDVEQPTTVDLTSLRVDESYEIVLTTVAGLYRYRLGDIVKCVGYYYQSPIVEFLYRQGSVLNFYYERVTESTILAAVAVAVKLLGNDCQLVDYTTCMEYSSQPWRYVVYMEVTKAFAAPPDLQLCQMQMDRTICELNEIYLKSRQASSIAPVVVKVVKQDTFNQLKKKSIFLKGTSETQFKMPRLLKDLEQVKLMESMVIYHS